MFTDGDTHYYSLNTLQLCKRLFIAEGDDKDTVEGNADEDEDFEPNNDGKEGDGDDDDGQCPLPTQQIDVDNNSVDVRQAEDDGNVDEEEDYGGKYFREMMELSLAELKARPTALEAHQDALLLPMREIAAQFSQLSLDGRGVKVRDWPNLTLELEAVLKKFDEGYSSDIRSWNALEERMPHAYKFLKDKDHVRNTEYMIQFRICSKADCSWCREKIGRGILTPMTNDGALRNEILGWINLPIPNPVDPEHYFSPEETRKYMIEQSPSLDDLEGFLPKATMNPKLSEDAKADKQLNSMFKGTKVRDFVTCDNCLKR